jgi:DNA-binding NtrC family response regulator
MDALLIIDDVAPLRAIQARLVRRAALAVGEVLTAGSLREARAVLAERTDVGVVLADHALGDGRGAELLSDAGLPPLVLVGGGAPPAGALAGLPKPYTAAALRAALEPLRAPARAHR